MVLTSTAEMVALVEEAGWQIQRVENIRRRTRPTLLVYVMRLPLSLSLSLPTPFPFSCLWAPMLAL
jgi:hypothetical protein